MITPLELEKIEFEKGLGNSYKKSSVDDVFEIIKRDYEDIYKENIAYRDKITVLEGLISKYKSIEDSMQSALLLAQQTGEEAIRVSREKADSMIKAAEEKAAAILNDADAERKKIIETAAEAKKSLAVFSAKNISLLEAQIEILKQIQNDCKEDL
jgi:cell division initiation protein